MGPKPIQYAMNACGVGSYVGNCVHHIAIETSLKQNLQLDMSFEIQLSKNICQKGHKNVCKMLDFNIWR